ncbi:MAG: twitching motility protein PilT [Thermoproteota archaeon]|nr:MAG: twitching motility protein PilT [Candidatus Korarchaeota archaeon]
MRFVDASVFVHAFMKPKRELKPHEVQIKNAAKGIVRRIDEGEEVAITVVQLAEIANILEDYMPLEEALEIEEFLLRAPNVKVVSISSRTCTEALELAKRKGVGLSDAIAYIAMLRNGIYEIYSFDKDFDKLEGVKRVSS